MATANPKRTTSPKPAAPLLVRDLYALITRDYSLNGRKSLRMLTSRWQNHLAKPFASVPAASLSNDQVAAFIDARRSEGASNATLNRDLAILKRMYKLAVIAGKLNAAPYFPHLKENNVRVGFLKPDGYEALARETEKIGLWLGAMFEVAHTFGWRSSELTNMRVGQVDLAERTLVLEVGSTKNGEGRAVEMTEKVFALMAQCVAGKEKDDYLFTRPAFGETLFREHDSPFWWIRSCSGGRERRRSTHTEDENEARAMLGSGRPRKISNFKDAWKTACARAGCPGLRFHDLRRTGIRNLIRAGVSEKIAMTISGHRTRAVFERYNIVNTDDLRDAVRKLEISAGHRQAEQAPVVAVPAPVAVQAPAIFIRVDALMALREGRAFCSISSTAERLFRVGQEPELPPVEAAAACVDEAANFIQQSDCVDSQNFTKNQALAAARGGLDVHLSETPELQQCALEGCGNMFPPLPTGTGKLFCCPHHKRVNGMRGYNARRRERARKAQSIVPKKKPSSSAAAGGEAAPKAGMIE